MECAPARLPANRKNKNGKLSLLWRYLHTRELTYNHFFLWVRCLALEDRTLVIGPSWVGDMVMAQALFKTILAHYPNTQIDVVAPNWSRPLTERMPEVQREIAIQLAHGELALKRRYQAAKQLRNTYARSFVLPNSFKSALIPYWANIPHRIGWRGEWRYGLLNDVRILNKQKYPLMLERYVALGHPKNKWPLEALPWPTLKVNAENIECALQKHKLSAINYPIISLCPGAEFGPSKRWPDKYYAEVATHFSKLGYQIWIFGSDKDKAVSDAIQAQSNHVCIDLCGHTSLAEAIDLMSLSHLVITNDSGLMHIAAALNRPLVAIYGSTDPGFTPPLSHQLKVVRTQIDCSPCFKRECPLKHHRCMSEVSPNQVIHAAMELIENESSHH